MPLTGRQKKVIDKVNKARESAQREKKRAFIQREKQNGKGKK
jgi:hypothetical protein